MRRRTPGCHRGDMLEVAYLQTHKLGYKLKTRSILSYGDGSSFAFFNQPPSDGLFAHQKDPGFITPSTSIRIGTRLD
jgi:hypothetical protein